MLVAYAHAPPGPHVFTFTSALFARYALAWVCSFTLELQPPTPMHRLAQHSRASRYDAQLALEGTAAPARTLNRTPVTVHAMHTSRASSAPQRSAEHVAEKLSGMFDSLCATADQAVRYRLSREIMHIGTRSHSPDAHALQHSIGSRLHALLDAEPDGRVDLESLRCGAHVLCGDMDAARDVLSALFQRIRDKLHNMLAVLAHNAHLRCRDPEVMCVYEAFAAVIAGIRARACGASALPETHAFILWLTRHPLASAFLQPTFPRVVAPIYTLLLNVGEPVRYVHEHYTELGQRGISLVCVAFTNRGAVERAALTALFAHKQRIYVEQAIMRRILRDLINTGLWILAQDIAARLSTRYSLSLSSMRVLAMLSAHLGDVREMTRRLRRLKTRSLPAEYSDPFMLQARIRCAAAQGNFQRMDELFRGPSAHAVALGQVPQPAGLPPNFVAATLVRMYAHAREVHKAHEVYQSVLERGALDETICVEYARVGAHLGDVELVSNVVEDAEERGIPLTTRLARMFATAYMQCHDPDGVVRVLRAYSRHGRRPDLRLYTVLLNAYVEAGRWSAALGTFRWLLQQRTPALMPDTAVYNTMLKAYVLRGVPETTVLAVLYKMCTAGMRPDGRTFALVLQRTCNAGHMQLAEGVFALLRSSLKKYGGPSVYHFSLMVHGYLRVGNAGRAEMYYREMCARGIEPTDVTFGMLIRMYTKNVDVPVDEAHALALQFLGTTSAATTAAAAPSEHVIMPLFRAHVDRGEYEEAHSMLAELINARVRLSGTALALLLRSYYHAGNTEGLFLAYQLVYDYVLSRCTAIEPPGELPTPGGPRTLLCPSLTVMIDYASLSGMPAVIADMWSRAQRDGFFFDPHNWNSICAAFARAGHIADALRVLETVLTENDPEEPVEAYAADPLHTPPTRMGPLGPQVRSPVHAAAKVHHDTSTGTEALSNLPEASADPASVDEYLLETADKMLVPEHMWSASTATLRVVWHALDHARRNAPEIDGDSAEACGIAALEKMHAPRLSRRQISALLHTYPAATARLVRFRRATRTRMRQ